jgi:hypothetical protein
MSQRSDIDRLLRHWMDDGPTRMPDRIVDVVADRISVQRQRRTWRLLRRLPMNQLFKLGAAAAAALVIAVVGWNLLPGRTGPASTPSPTPTPTLAPSPTPFACEDDLAGCAGALAAGDHQSAHFVPAFEYRTPAGWENRIDIETIFALTPFDTTADRILVWSDIRPAEATSECTIAAKADADTSVTGWMTYLMTNPGLIASNAHEAPMNGSIVQVVDLQRNPAWTSPCIQSQGLEDVPIIKVQPSSPGDGYGLNPGARLRAYVVGLGNQTALVTLYSYEPGEAALAAAVATGESIVTTFRWACNSDAGPGPCWGPPDASGNPATPPPTP